MNFIWIIIIFFVILFIEIPWNGLSIPKYSLHNHLNNIIIKTKHTYFNVPLNKNICHENLAIIHKVLNEHDIFFWLSEGTALGFTRENDFISHDDDLDIGIFEKDKEKFINCLDTLKEYGFSVAEIMNDNNFYALIRKGEKVDVDITGLNSNCISCSKAWTREPCKKIIPYLKFTKKEINGKIYNLPTVPYLEFLYGKDWMIPKRSKVV